MRMEITLKQLLAHRDARDAYEKELLRRHAGCCLAVFTLVWPGADKNAPETSGLFAAGIAALVHLWSDLGVTPLSFETYSPQAGPEAFILLREDAHEIKRALCALEESVPYGRLWDMDVIGADGQRLSREAVGFSERGCIVCGAEGRACASRRLHPVHEVIAAAKAIAALRKPSGGEPN